MEEREQDNDDKTEEATEERRRQFREQGNIASPRELLSALALASFVVIMLFSGKYIVRDLNQMFHRAFQLFNFSTLKETQIREQVMYVLMPVIPWAFGGGILMLAAPMMAGLVVTNFHWTWSKLEFKFEKLNPTDGVMRMFGFSALGEAVKSVLKLIVVGSIMYVVLRSEVLNASILFWHETASFGKVWSDATSRLLIAAAIASCVYGAADYGFNLFRIERQMMMSKKELKDEIKGQEGDPHVRSARRRMARDLVLRKNLSQVQNATFVVTNPQHFAVALRYVKGMAAPIVVAKGQDFLALRIREIAKKHDIAIVEHKPLARTLYKTVKIGQEIPSSLYALVIEVMKFVYRTRGRNYFDRFGVQPFAAGQRRAPADANPAPAV